MADGPIRRIAPAFRVRLIVGFLIAAFVPLAVFGSIVIGASLVTNPELVVPLFVAALVGAVLLGVALAALAAGGITGPLRQITAAVERVSAGESGPALPVVGDDELARLAESHNVIAARSQRRNHELAALLAAIGEYKPAAGPEALRQRAEADACLIYGMIDCQILLVDPGLVPASEAIPGDPLPVRANVRAGSETLGVLSGRLPATRSWERADQDLLDLFSNEVGVALRNAQLFGQIEDQNERLRQLDAAKDEFLRSVSHNLQTPLTSIRAYVDQLRATGVDGRSDGTAEFHRRLDVVAEQTDRLTRLVRQLLTVTRLEAGVLRSQDEVMALAPRIRRAWEALNAPTEFELRDASEGWLAVADPDQLDQVLWALLDNAVKYGGREGRVEADVRPDPKTKRLLATIADHGRGVSRQDRDRLFGRFSRGMSQPSGDGTGLGLYVSRQLLRAMSGDLWLEPARKGWGAEFTFALPGEPPGTEG